MRKINNYTKFMFIGLIGILVSCTNGFEEINTPPTSSTEVDPGIVLAFAQRNKNFRQGNEWGNCIVGTWVQHWNAGNNFPASRYINSRVSWIELYNYIKNVAQIRNHLLLGQENSPEGRTRLAIARIVEIDIWQTITDAYGDMPFSESALGEKDLITHPKYDTQEAIYTELISSIDDAISKLNTTDKSYGTYDLYYQGDVSKWIKYGNAVKLQLGMRLKYVKPELAKKVVSEALNSTIISGNEDNAKINTSTAYQTSYHPVLNHFARGSADYRYLGEAFVNELVKTNDPRLTYIVQPTANSVKAGKPEYRGKIAAPTDDELVGVINDDYSTASLNTYFSLAYNAATPIPYYIYTYSEICFYKAEAALEGWAGLTPDQAEGFFKEGVTAAMALEPYFITDIPQEYIDTQLSFAGLTSEQKLEKIMTQKWILFFGRSYDAFAEWRRTGYPTLTPGHNKGSTNGQIPRRMLYPDDEILLNNENYMNNINKMSDGDSYMSRVWWDCK